MLPTQAVAIWHIKGVAVGRRAAPPQGGVGKRLADPSARKQRVPDALNLAGILNAITVDPDDADG
jgi:hypothetical protein